MFGGFGSGDAGGKSAGAQAASQGVKSAAVDDAIYWMENAGREIRFIEPAIEGTVSALKGGGH